MKIKILPVILLLLASILLLGIFSYRALNSLGYKIWEAKPEETISAPGFSSRDFTLEAQSSSTVSDNDITLPLKKLPDNFSDVFTAKSNLELSYWEKSELLNYSVSELSTPLTTFTAGYKNLLDQNVPVFISADSVLHYLNTQNSLIYYNLVVEKLYPLLDRLLDNLISIHESWQKGEADPESNNALESNLQIFREAENLLNTGADEYSAYLIAIEKLAGFNGKDESGGWSKQAELIADALKETDALSLWRKVYTAESYFSGPSPNSIADNDTGVEIVPFNKAKDLKLDFLNEQEFLEGLNEISEMPAEKIINSEATVVKQGLLNTEKIFSRQKTLYGKYLEQKTVLAFLLEAEARNSYIEIPADLTGQKLPMEEQEVYLQPEVELFANLVYLLKYIYQGLEEQDLLTSYGSSVLASSMDLFANLEFLAGRELTPQGITGREQILLKEFLIKVVALQSTQPDAQEAQYLTLVGKSQETSQEKIFLGLVYSKFPEVNPWLVYSENSRNFIADYDVPLTEQAKGTVRIPVLMYHNITAQPDNIKTRHLYVTPEMFEEQMAYLVRKNYRSLTPKEFYDILKSGKNPEQKSVMITFDDGTIGHYQNAYPILKKYSLTGVFYVPSSKSAISRQRLREMSDNGMVIDSHSTTHADLTKITDDASFADEIQNSKYALQAATGKQVVSIAYPGCVAKSKALAWTQSSAYLLGFSCGKVIDHRFSQRFVLSRLHIYNNFENYVRRLSGYYEIPADY